MDTVTVTHPKLPGVELVKSVKRANAMTRNGWKIAKEPKSPPAPAVDENQTPDTGTHPEEGPK